MRTRLQRRFELGGYQFDLGTCATQSDVALLAGPLQRGFMDCDTATGARDRNTGRWKTCSAEALRGDVAVVATQRPLGIGWPLAVTAEKYQSIRVLYYSQPLSVGVCASPAPKSVSARTPAYPRILKPDLNN
jgi:hypothetical protein